MPVPAAKADDVVVIEDKPQRSGPSCGSCPHFAPQHTNAQAIAGISKIGGDPFRGPCNLMPTPVIKSRGDVCGQHPELLAAQHQQIWAPIAKSVGAEIGLAIAVALEKRK